MTRSELMALLDKRLSVLNEAEREDIKQDYSQHIEMKMHEGLSELEAVASLGDIETIIDETLMAYNIDPNYTKKAQPDVSKKIRQALNSEFAQKTGETLNKGLDAVHKAVQTNTPFDILKAVLKIFLFLAVSFMLFVIGFGIFSVIAEITEDVLPGIFMIDKIVSGAIKLLYIVVSVTALCVIAYSFITKNADIVQAKLIKEVPEMNDSEYTSENTNNVKRTQPSAASKIIDIFIFLVKICVIFAILPCIFMLIGTIAAQGLLAAALFMGYPTLGLSIGCLGVNVCTITFLIFVFKLLVGERGGKNEA